MTTDDGLGRTLLMDLIKLNGTTISLSSKDAQMAHWKGVKGNTARTLETCQDANCGQTGEVHFPVDRKHWVIMRASKGLNQVKIVIKLRSN